MNSGKASFTVANRHALLPVIVALGLALIGPFIWKFFIGSYIETYMDTIPFVFLGQGFLWLLTIGVVCITLLWERNSLASIGIAPLTWRMVLLAVGLGILLSLLVPLLGFLASLIFHSSEGGTVQSTSTAVPVWLLFIAILTASVTEEVLFRAYPLERVTALTGSKWLAAILSLGAFVAFHLQGWSLAHIFGVVLPLGAILTALYLWRRNLVFNVIVHFLIDLPLVLIAAGILPTL